METNFALNVSSLKFTALAQIAVSLWKFDSNISLNWLPVATREKQWAEFESNICKQIKLFYLPPRIKSILLIFVKQIGMELYEWNDFMYKNVFFAYRQKVFTNYVNQTRFTSQGKVNPTETARILSKWEELPIEIQFDTACVFCIPDRVMDIWKNLSHYERTIAKNKIYNFSPLYDYWLERITGDKIETDELDLFINAFEDNNLTAMKYFWSRMKSNEKNIFFDNLLSASISSNSLKADTMCFLLSKMNNDQLDIYFTQNKAYRFSTELLNDWVYITLYLPFVKRLCRNGDFDYVFNNMADFISREKNQFHCEYTKMCFEDLLSISTPEVRERIMSREIVNLF